jgi:hypothetical protein
MNNHFMALALLGLLTFSAVSKAEELELGDSDFDSELEKHEISLVR